MVHFYVGPHLVNQCDDLGVRKYMDRVAAERPQLPLYRAVFSPPGEGKIVAQIKSFERVEGDILRVHCRSFAIDERSS